MIFGQPAFVRGVLVDENGSEVVVTSSNSNTVRHHHKVAKGWYEVEGEFKPECGVPGEDWLLKNRASLWSDRECPECFGGESD